MIDGVVCEVRQQFMVVGFGAVVAGLTWTWQVVTGHHWCCALGEPQELEDETLVVVHKRMPGVGVFLHVVGDEGALEGLFKLEGSCMGPFTKWFKIAIAM